jgi:flagellar basal body rod protein FlgG
MNISANTSSINAHQDLLSNSSHNLANSTTKGYERIQTDITQSKENQPVATTTIEENNTPYSNTDLVKEISDQIISYHAVGANSVAIKTKNETQQTLLDIYA